MPDTALTPDVSVGGLIDRWWYEPFTVWTETFRSFYNPQLIVNNTQDLPVERQILREVGSYGYQIGLISKVLDVLVAEHTGDRPPQQQAVVEEYREYRARVNGVLAEQRGPRPTDLSLGYVPRLGSALKGLRESDPAEYRKRVTELANLVKELSAELPAAITTRA